MNHINRDINAIKLQPYNKFNAVSFMLLHNCHSGRALKCCFVAPKCKKLLVITFLFLLKYLTECHISNAGEHALSCQCKASIQAHI